MPNRFKPFRFRFVLFAFTGTLGIASGAWAQAEFYKGKTITVYAGTTPGALYDQWSRVLNIYPAIPTWSCRTCREPATR
jgi:hypothetical protein